MKKILKKSFLFSLGLLVFATSNSLADTNISRIAGSDRYETSLKVNQKYFTKADGELAVIVSGEDFKSALYGSQLANALKVPYYVIPNASVSKPVLNDLKNKDVDRSFVIGDYNILNKSVDNSLKSNYVFPTRYTDKSPYEFCQGLEWQIDWAIFDTFFNGEPRGDIGNAILVNDNKFPDLLSAIPFTSALAREYRMCVTGYDAVESTTTGGFGFIIGGYNSIPSNYTAEGDSDFLTLQESNETSKLPGRIAGADRYKTAVEIAKAYKLVLNKKIKTAVIVDGTNYPDALSSGIVATFSDGVALLTEPNRLNQDTKKFIQENNIKNIIIVGGEKSVSKEVENELSRI